MWPLLRMPSQKTCRTLALPDFESGDEMISFKKYVDRMQMVQSDSYYISGTSFADVAFSIHRD